MNNAEFLDNLCLVYAFLQMEDGLFNVPDNLKKSRVELMTKIKYYIDSILVYDFRYSTTQIQDAIREIRILDDELTNKYEIYLS